MERDKKYASRNALRITNLAVIILLIIVLLFWWRGNSNGDVKLKGVNPNQISIRQDNGQIQYQFLDGEWQNIISISELKGEKGEAGANGRDGANGKNGENGAPGKDGNNGANGKDGKDGVNGANGRDGAQGAKGDKGDKGDRGEQGIQGPQGLKGEQGIQGIAGVGVPQTLSLNNGILSLSHGGGNVTLPQANFSEIVKIPLNSAHPTSVFSSGSAGERTWHDFRNYMIFNKTTGQGFIHIDFWTTGSTIMALVNIPNSAPTPKELSETPLNNDDNSTVWIEKGSRTIYGRPRANKRYIANIPIFVDPSR